MLSAKTQSDFHLLPIGSDPKASLRNDGRRSASIATTPPFSNEVSSSSFEGREGIEEGKQEIPSVHGGDNSDDDDDDCGYRTPTSPLHRIPPPLVCPQAPRKPPLSSRKRRTRDRDPNRVVRSIKWPDDDNTMFPIVNGQSEDDNDDGRKKSSRTSEEIVFNSDFVCE